MVQIITAPNHEKAIFHSVFLAGGISNCPDWQSEVIKHLDKENITIFNPRRKNFNIADLSATTQQIKWEFDRLEEMDIFSMYFCASESDQPICMYELGRYVERMQVRFPLDWEKRIIISVEKEYKRSKDVFEQLHLSALNLLVDANPTPETHAIRIRNAFIVLQKTY